MTFLRPITKYPPPQEVQVMAPIGAPSGAGQAYQPFASVGGGGGSVSIPLLRGSNVKLIIPPGGFAGFAQQTAATQEMFRRAGRLGGRTTQRRRRRKTAKKTVKRAARATKRTRNSKKPARLVKGSAAAKRYMASIRRKRKK